MRENNNCNKNELLANDDKERNHTIIQRSTDFHDDPHDRASINTRLDVKDERKSHTLIHVCLIVDVPVEFIFDSCATGSLTLEGL